LLTILKLDSGQASKAALLTKLMKMDPKQRVSAKVALDTSYFQEPPMYSSK
jgi:hypothetical protein